MDAFVFFSKKKKEEKERAGEGRGGEGKEVEEKKEKENRWLVSGLIQVSRTQEQCRSGAGTAEPARC